MEPEMALIFRCRVCGHEEKIFWARVPAVNGRFVEKLTWWCTKCAQFGDGWQVFLKTTRRMVGNVEIVAPPCLN